MPHNIPHISPVPLYTAKELTEIFPFSQNYFAILLSKKKIKGERVGNKYYYYLDSVRRYIDSFSEVSSFTQDYMDNEL